MGRKGGTALVYEHMIENIGKYWKIFEKCIRPFDKLRASYSKKV